MHCASLSIIDEPLVGKQCAQTRQNQNRVKSLSLSLCVSVHSGGQQWTAVRAVRWVGVMGSAWLLCSPGLALSREDPDTLQIIWA